MKGELASICFLALIAGMPEVAFAQCPEGKSEIILVTPSGKIKTICVGSEAVDGIENAAEHSDGTLVTASCPCWSATDLDYLVTKVYPGGLVCIRLDNQYYDGYTCNGLDGTGTVVKEDLIQWILLSADDGICYEPSGLKHEIGVEEAKACQLLLQGDKHIAFE